MVLEIINPHAMFLPIWLFEERGDDSSFEQSRIPYSTIKFDILSPQNLSFLIHKQTDSRTFRDAENCRLASKRLELYVLTITRESYVLAIRY